MQFLISICVILVVSKTRPILLVQSSELRHASGIIQNKRRVEAKTEIISMSNAGDPHTRSSKASRGNPVINCSERPMEITS